MASTAAWRLANPPRSPREESWLASGYRQLESGRYGYAYVRFRKALSINGGNDEARTMLDILDIYGYLLHKQPRPGTLARYERARAQHPDSPYVYMIGGELKLRAGDAKEAIALHLEAASHKPDLIHNWYGLGMAYRAAGQQDDAVVVLERAAASDKRALYHLELANQYFHGRKFIAAAGAFRDAYEKSARLIDARIGELRSLLLAGRYDDVMRMASALGETMAQHPPKMVRRSPRVALAADIDHFEWVTGMTLDSLHEYVDQLNQWARDLASGGAGVGLAQEKWAGSPLLPVLQLDLALLP